MLVTLDENIIGSKMDILIHDPSVDLGVSDYIYKNKCWEPFETQIFRQLVEGALLFFDVGANIGYYSLIASKLIDSNGAIMSIEPEDINFSLLLENIRINDIRSIRPINAGCLESDNGANIVKSGDNYGDHRLQVSNNDETHCSIETITLDKLISFTGRIPDFIKIDTQGCELSILKGLTNTLDDHMDNVCMLLEYWPHGIAERGDSTEEFIDFLSKYDFSMCAIFEESESIIGCNGEDLKRWTSTIMTIESKRYINLLIWGRNCYRALELFNKYKSLSVYSNVGGTQPTVINSSRLNPVLVPLGWSYPEDTGVWTDGQFAEIIFPLEHLLNLPDTLQLELYPFVCDEREQQLKIDINGVNVCNYRFTKEENIILNIPINSNLILTNNLRIVVGLEMPLALSPQECGRSNDKRELGVFLKNFMLLKND